MDPRCEMTYMRNYVRHRCQRMATQDGYCWQHHPDAEAKRKQESYEHYKRESKRRQEERVAPVRRERERIQQAVTKELESFAQHECLSGACAHDRPADCNAALRLHLGGMKDAVLAVFNEEE